MFRIIPVLIMTNLLALPADALEIDAVSPLERYALTYPGSSRAFDVYACEIADGRVKVGKAVPIMMHASWKENGLPEEKLFWVDPDMLAAAKPMSRAMQMAELSGATLIMITPSARTVCDPPKPAPAASPRAAPLPPPEIRRVTRPDMATPPTRP